MTIQKTHRKSFNFVFFFVDFVETLLPHMDFKQVASYIETSQFIY